MAVVFADITDSTSLYQKLGDVTARKVVNTCLTLATGTLARYDGRLVKTIGDAVMCIFPSADLAVLAASDMQSQVSANKAGNYPVSIHIGLHYGPVLVEDGDVFGDTGALLVILDEERVRVDQWRTGVLVGRSKDCDLVVTDKFASRKHLTIKLVRTHFYLFDHSINGSFVSLESGEEVHVLRSELLLDGSGQISLGHSRAERPAEVITFTRDRRSMFRF